jgi:ribosomal protein L13E
MQEAKPIVKKGYSVRKGRGYSLQELQEVNISPRVARKNGVPVDVWRQTKHPENAEQLKPIQKAIESRIRENQQNNNKPARKHMRQQKKKVEKKD